MLLQQAFERSAERLPNKVALVSGARRVSYGELARRIGTLASLLVADGVRHGDRVLLLLESDIEYAVAVHAVLAVGAVFVPLGVTSKAERLAFVAAETQAVVLLTDRRLEGAWSGLDKRCPSLRCIRLTEGFDIPCTPAALPAASIDQDLAAILYTSGTTGKPKGVMLTHLNMCSAWESVQSYLALREDDVLGLALPPTFSYGLYNLLMSLGVGATVLLERAAFPLKLAETIQRERVTVLPGVPTLLAALLDQAQLARMDHGALRVITSAAAALPLRDVARIRAAWPRARLFSMYGMTECMRISYLPPEEIERRPGSVGRGMPNQEHWLVDELGQRLPLGATGELVLRGSHVMRGYWRRPEETAQRLHVDAIDRDVVLRTGDLFCTDADGWLHFIGRTDDIIKTRGEKVSPREVEDVILALEAVSSCAVVGIPDDILGEAVKAYVTLKQGFLVSERNVVRHCLQHLESYMAPKVVVIVDELPQTESGKLRRADLRRP